MTEKNETIKFINAQALVVTAVFGLFGGALTNFLDIPEMSTRYISIASLLGLVLILLIKLLLKLPNRTRIKQLLKIIATVLFIALVYSLFRFDKIHEDSTFVFTRYDSVSTRYIKGSPAGLQPAANTFIEWYKKTNGKIPSDQDLMDNAGANNNIKSAINSVWTETSVIDNRRLLFQSYILMSMLFLASIYFITEVLLNFFKEKKTEKKFRLIKHPAL
jgi:hypothetical protein